MYFSLIIVAFVRNIISGEGISSKSALCHNNIVDDARIRIQLNKCTLESYHPNKSSPMELGAFTTVPLTSILYRLVYVIAWVPIVFGINCASNVGRN